MKALEIAVGATRDRTAVATRVTVRQVQSWLCLPAPQCLCPPPSSPLPVCRDRRLVLQPLGCRSSIKLHEPKTVKLRIFQAISQPGHAEVRGTRTRLVLSNTRPVS